MWWLRELAQCCCFNVTEDILLPGDTVLLNYLLLEALSKNVQFDSILSVNV